MGRSANLMNLDTQKKDALERINQITTQLDSLSAEMREQSTRAKMAEVHMGSVPKRVQTQLRNVPNQYSVERLHTLLVELNNKRTEALTKFSADDRLVVEIDQQMKTPPRRWSTRRASAPTKSPPTSTRRGRSWSPSAS